MKKVMIIDIDLHHGNGIQNAFYESDQVLYASMHHFPSYPGTGKFGEVGTGKGEGFTVNIPLGKGQGDEDLRGSFILCSTPLPRPFSLSSS